MSDRANGASSGKPFSASTTAEKISGSEEAFAERMTAMARSLGMARTVFRNASGLPNDGQVTTARDLAVLARELA